MPASRLTDDHRLSVAPMMKRTDRHFRWMVRQISSRVLLYTEMVVTDAILHGDRHRFLETHPEEHSLALQLGGDDPGALAACSEIAESYGYAEVNLNVGCPSDRVQSGCFGAVLMRTPERVADAVRTMRSATSLPVTVKHRIGVDELDRYEDMLRFVDIVADAGADRFTVHARIALLDGLSPKDNRSIPPLRYDDVYRLKKDRPSLTIELNGGVRTLDDTCSHLQHVDAVMIGRAAYDRPWLLAQADAILYDEATPPDRTRVDVARRVRSYLASWMNVPHFKPHHVTRHLSNLFVGVPGAAAWRRTLATHCHRGPEAIDMALDAMAAASGSVPDHLATGQEIHDQHPAT